MKRSLVIGILPEDRKNVHRLTPFARVCGGTGLDFETIHPSSLDESLATKGQSVVAVVFSDTHNLELIKKISDRFRYNFEVVVIVVTDALKMIETIRKIPVTIVVDCETTEFAQRLNHYWLKNNAALRNALQIEN